MATALSGDELGERTFDIVTDLLKEVDLLKASLRQIQEEMQKMKERVSHAEKNQWGLASDLHLESIKRIKEIQELENKINNQTKTTVTPTEVRQYLTTIPKHTINFTNY